MSGFKTPLIAVSGPKKSGKTTLIEKLISALTLQGYKIGAVKYNLPQFQIDYPGKDTYRFYEAGARSVLISTDTKLALIKKQDTNIPFEKVMETYFSEDDLILVEGGWQLNIPKIEIIQPGKSSKIPLPELLATVGTTNPGLNIPHFHPEQIAPLCEFLISKFLLT